MATEHALSTEKQIVSAGSFRRYLEAAVFVAVWMLCGWLFRLEDNLYQFLGVPLLVLFQLGVRRRRLSELWLRDPEQPLRLDRWAVALALVFSVVPAFVLTQMLSRVPWIESAYGLCVVAGSIAAGLTIRSQSVSTLRRGLPFFGLTLLIGFALMVLLALLLGLSPVPSLTRAPLIIRDILVLFAVTFVLEEVAFRGGLDTHVFPYGIEAKSRARVWVSAIFVSLLWAIWHIPPQFLYGEGTFAEVLTTNLIVEILIGVPLSFTWRKSGSLVLPALAHALIDAYRNSLLT
jgi:membrane protease YdiL (CAAX protease family)